MKNFLYSILILGPLGWHLFSQAPGDPLAYFLNLRLSAESLPELVLLSCAALTGLALLFETIFIRGGKTSPSALEINELRESQEDLKALKTEKRELEDELLRSSEREDDLGKRQSELEAAAADLKKQLGIAKKNSARTAEVEAELCNFLGIMQQKGRFVDFLMEDVTGYTNDQVGAAARVVHQGCSEVVKKYFQISPVHSGKEGEPVSLKEQYDPSRYKLLGEAPQHPPYNGKLLHKGWKAEQVTLPRIVKSASSDAARDVIAPAEVELKAA